MSELISRADVRAGLAAVLAAELGDFAAATYGHLPADLRGQTPVVCVGSGGAYRELQTAAGAAARFHLEIHNFVLMAQAGNDAYTPADAEARLDALELAVGRMVARNPTHGAGLWKRLAYEGRSTIDSVTIGGELYWDEIIPIIVEVF